MEHPPLVDLTLGKLDAGTQDHHHIQQVVNTPQLPAHDVEVDQVKELQTHAQNDLSYQLLVQVLELLTGRPVHQFHPIHFFVVIGLVIAALSEIPKRCILEFVILGEDGMVQRPKLALLTRELHRVPRLAGVLVLLQFPMIKLTLQGLVILLLSCAFLGPDQRIVLPKVLIVVVLVHDILRLTLHDLVELGRGQLGPDGVAHAKVVIGLGTILPLGRLDQTLLFTVSEGLVLFIFPDQGGRPDLLWVEEKNPLADHTAHDHEEVGKVKEVLSVDAATAAHFCFLLSLVLVLVLVKFRF